MAYILQLSKVFHTCDPPEASKNDAYWVFHVPTIWFSPIWWDHIATKYVTGTIKGTLQMSKLTKVKLAPFHTPTMIYLVLSILIVHCCLEYISSHYCTHSLCATGAQT